MKSFIKINQTFWKNYNEPVNTNLLLVETSHHPVIFHSNAVVGKMIAQAKNLTIAWIGTATNPKILLSYSPTSICLSFLRPDLLLTVTLFLQALFYYIYFSLHPQKLLTFTYRGIPYGDFVYDGYLSHCSVATLHRYDIRLITVFNQVLIKDNQARKIINKYPIKAVLVSHYVGLEFGPLSRVALQQRIPVYWRSGGHGIITLSIVKNLSERYAYPIRPTINKINQLVKNQPHQLTIDFRKLINHVNNPYYGAFSVAYNGSLKSKVTRQKFITDLNLTDKPLVFILLHAFNDHPHSHFGKMLFNDYFDWFQKTYRFACQNPSKNWIFKEHPANQHYPTMDFNLNRFMQHTPSHVKFIARNSSITAATVLNVADLIVTCLGTAGIEMPALRGIPSLIAARTFYDGLGFTLEPKSRRAYFDILKQSHYQKLSHNQRLKAQASYVYFKKYVLFPFHAGPKVTLQEILSPELLRSSYYNRIISNYGRFHRIIYKEFNECIKQIQKEKFRCLTNLPPSY